MVFLFYLESLIGSNGGPGSSSDKALGYEQDGPDSIPGWSISSLFRVKTGPGIHSTSCKMSNGAFPGIKTAERRTSHPTSS